MNMENNIRKIIKEKQLKIVDIINKSGLSKSYFYDVMNGNSVPTLTMARLIAKVIEAPLENVFPDHETMNDL